MTQYLKKSNNRSVSLPVRYADYPEFSPAISPDLSLDYAKKDNASTFWHCKHIPSRIHQCLLLTAGFSSTAAIITTNVSIVAQCCCLGLVVVLFACQWKKRAASHIIKHRGGPQSSINDWWVTNNRGFALKGKLLHQGYRSAGLLIMVFRSHDEKCTYTVPVWSDSVSEKVFSYLNLQMMFNTHKPAAYDKNQA